MKIKKKKDGNKTYFTNDWMSFYPEFCMPSLTYEKAGYFDERPQINISITNLVGLIGLVVSAFTGPTWLLLSFAILTFISWGKIYLHLPFKTGINECESPKYGFYVYSHIPWKPMSFVLCFGKKLKHYDFPWTWDWVRTSTKLKDGTWFHETKNNRLNWFTKNSEYGTYNWLEKNKWSEEYDYSYTRKNGEVQKVKATVCVVEREWRWKALKWLSFPKKVHTDIDVNFNTPIGEGVDTWKGGGTGCGYRLKKGETPLDALRKMEKERKFNR